MHTFSKTPPPPLPLYIYDAYKASPAPVSALIFDPQNLERNVDRG